MATVPVWAWLPGRDLPVHAGELTVGAADGRFRYAPAYLALDGAVALDPVELRLVRAARGLHIHSADGLPGVIRDAKPAGYGADRLNASAGVPLSPLELLERGMPDGVGAIEVCADIDRKLSWQPNTLDDLRTIAENLDSAAPASRAVRKLHQDMDTSAGGERPKTTLRHDGRLWLAKMQDRGDRPAMPSREFVTMRLARLAGLDAAPVELHTFGTHQVLLVERFDRTGDPLRPQRLLYASAHTALRLAPASTRGDAQRSYLHLGDRLRVWAKGSPALGVQLQELWRRMVFNALVGNVDDHPLNHGLLHDGHDARSWHLAPAFDITPASTALPQPLQDGPALSMATGADGLSRTGIDRLLASARHFGLADVDARQWLHDTAGLIAENWARLLREAAKPIVPDDARMAALVSDVGISFAHGEWMARQV